MFDVNAFADGVLGVVGTIAAGFGLHKVGWLKIVQKELPVIEKGAEITYDVVKKFLESPAGAAIKAELTAKLHEEESQFRKSEIGRLAATGLNAFAADLKGLSQDQKEALVLHLASLLPFKVTEAELTAALEEAQKLSDEIAGNKLIGIANEFTAQKQAAAQPVETEKAPA